MHTGQRWPPAPAGCSGFRPMLTSWRGGARCRAAVPLRQQSRPAGLAACRVCGQGRRAASAPWHERRSCGSRRSADRYGAAASTTPPSGWAVPRAGAWPSSPGWIMRSVPMPAIARVTHPYGMQLLARPADPGGPSGHRLSSALRWSARAGLWPRADLDRPGCASGHTPPLLRSAATACCWRPRRTAGGRLRRPPRPLARRRGGARGSVGLVVNRWTRGAELSLRGIERGGGRTGGAVVREGVIAAAEAATRPGGVAAGDRSRDRPRRLDRPLPPPGAPGGAASRAKGSAIRGRRWPRARASC